MKKQDNLKRLESAGVVAILRGISEDKLYDTVKALHAGGVDCIEVTYNTPGASRMISFIRDNFGCDILVGAGTVTDEKTALEAVSAGAQYILSPSLHKEVIDVCLDKGIVCIPGVYTPTEMVMAQKWGADIVKLFPAGTGGAEYVKLVRGPLNDVKIMAVGGVNIENTASFIKAGCIAVGIGSALANDKYIAAGEFDKITDLARGYIQAVKSARGC